MISRQGGLSLPLPLVVVVGMDLPAEMTSGVTFPKIVAKVTVMVIILIQATHLFQRAVAVGMGLSAELTRTVTLPEAAVRVIVTVLIFRSSSCRFAATS